MGTLWTEMGALSLVGTLWSEMGALSLVDTLWAEMGHTKSTEECDLFPRRSIYKGSYEIYRRV